MAALRKELVSVLTPVKSNCTGCAGSSTGLLAQLRAIVWIDTDRANQIVNADLGHGSCSLYVPRIV